MTAQTELEKVGKEVMRFLRGKYKLDEVAGKCYDIDCLKFRQGKKTVVSINIHEDRYEFQIIYGKAERAAFEARKNEFPQAVRDIYDSAKTYHDGKWMLFPVTGLAELEVVKKLILIKKKPNRKPFAKDGAVYSDCGHRCDLCVHYTGGTISEEFRLELKERIKRVYEPERAEESKYWGEDMMLCPGCTNKDKNEEPCHTKKCAASKGVARCVDCGDYDCGSAMAGLNNGIECRSISADDVTWAILPYVKEQYGN